MHIGGLSVVGQNITIFFFTCYIFMSGETAVEISTLIFEFEGSYRFCKLRMNNRLLLRALVTRMKNGC